VLSSCLPLASCGDPLPAPPAPQIGNEFNRFAKFMPGIKCAVLFGGLPRGQHIKLLEDEKPQVVVGTPGRVWDLIQSGNLKVDKVKVFILDECDKMLEALDMRKTVQDIFMKTPHEKQARRAQGRARGERPTPPSPCCRS
jgi:ATP-dependent RNA helicase UAP56/SUB2